MMGAGESIHTVALTWGVAWPCLPKLYGVCVEDISGARTAKRFHPLPHQFVNKKVTKNEITTLEDGDFCVSKRRVGSARSSKYEGWLQRKTLRVCANARRSGCQAATTLGMGCKKIIA